jgi:hypothetical protein
MLLAGIGFYFSYHQVNDKAKISDLKITTIDHGIEIAVGINTDSKASNEQELLKEIEKLTGLDTTKAEVKIIIDDEPKIE